MEGDSRIWGIWAFIWREKVLGDFNWMIRVFRGYMGGNRGFTWRGFRGLWVFGSSGGGISGVSRGGGFRDYGNLDLHVEGNIWMDI